jgi:enoyl-CoA hydratase/carnithine racemase
MSVKRIIKKVAVLGAGAMGCGIACHFANAGLQVLLLDVAGEGAGAKSRNKPVNDALAAALKSNPSPIYSKSFINRIVTRNFEEDMPKIADCDWVIAGEDEEPGINQQLFEQVDKFRRPGTPVTSAADGSPAEGLSEDFRKHFCGLHFSGMLRYAESMEIVPTPATLPEVVDFLMFYIETHLGKTTVLTKDAARLFMPESDSVKDEAIPGSNTIWENGSAAINDLGDGIINLEFRTDIFTNEIIDSINKAVSLAEQSYKGMVISGSGADFSTRMDAGLLYKLATAQRFDEIDELFSTLQQTIMRVRYSAIPVVAAVHKKVLGAGCQLCLHADKVVAHAELYMGLNELSRGLIPAGGGTKEFVLRLNDELQEGDVEVNNFRQRFLTIAQSKVSTSAYEAFEFGYLKNGRDVVVMARGRLLAEAKKQCVLLADEGYVQPIRRNNIRVLGKLALGLGYSGANSMYAGNYITEYEMQLSQKLAFVMAGGDLSMPTVVSEDYLLDLEREVFLELCAEPKTLERMKYILAEGKILRN